MLNNGLSHAEIIDQLQISRSTFYEYLKHLRDVEAKVWEKVEIDSAKYRALALLRSFEETVRICSLIAKANNTSNKDRIEARKAVDMANAHIFRLVSEGTMFHHLPEVSKYVKVIEANSNQQLPDSTTTPDNNISIEEEEEEDNKDNNNNILSSSSSSDSDSDVI